MLKGPAKTVRRARSLRRTMTLPEILVWQVLRVRPAGLKFRRQHPAGPYVLDFYCSTARLAIEVDGVIHDRGDRPARDAIRDAWLASKGVVTLRIVAADILRDLDSVITHIVEEAMSRLPLHQPPTGPPPRSGEE